MKQFIYILISLLWMSCANDNKNKSESAVYNLEELSTEEDEVYMELKPISYEALATQKLVDYYDLLRLKQEHPEFEDDILLQLQGFSEDSILNNSDESIDSIKNIRQFGSVLKASDSIQKVKLYFEIVSGETVKTDSILAVITVKSMLLDGEMMSNYKISFKKIN